MTAMAGRVMLTPKNAPAAGRHATWSLSDNQRFGITARC